jgi:hypothetical protein
MIPEAHPLIEAITEPFANNAERWMSARAFLGEKFDPAHPSVADATSRLEAASRRRFPALRKVLPWAFAVIVLAGVIFSNASKFVYAIKVATSSSFEYWEKGQLPAGLTEEERLLLGDPAIDDLEQKRRLHLIAPENPAYFAEYAQEFVSGKEALPPDFLETTDRIAPNNSFFPYFAAGLMGKESISKNKRSGPSPPARFSAGIRLSALPREAEYTIKDQAAFDAAMILIAKAATFSDFQTYMNPMIAARVRLVPTNNLPQFTHALICAYGASSGMIQLRLVLDLMCARAEQLSKSGRKEEFLVLARQRDAFISHLGHNPDIILIGELVHQVIVAGTATNFRFAAERLGLTELAETYRKQSDAFREDRDLRDIRSAKEGDLFPQDQASFLIRQSISMLGRQVNSPPPVSAAELGPMRRAEYEFTSGFGVVAAAAIILLAALVVFLFRFITPPMIRLPAKRMADVLGVLDWVWVTGVGILLPVSFFLVVTRLTPLGDRYYGEYSFYFWFPGVQLVALLLGLLIVPGIIVRWRLEKRLAPLGLSDRFTVPLFLVTLAMIFVWSLAALPFLVRFGMGGYLALTVLAAPPALCLGLVFANALRTVIGKPATRLWQCATAVAVLPAYPIAIIVLCCLTPLFAAGEKHWLAKETLLRINPDAPDLGAYEFKVAAQKRKEINAITGTK